MQFGLIFLFVVKVLGKIAPVVEIASGSNSIIIRIPRIGYVSSTIHKRYVLHNIVPGAKRRDALSNYSHICRLFT